MRAFLGDERRVLEAVLWHGKPSRHELAVLTRFSKSKLNALVGLLVAEGWLEEGEHHGSSGGRPALSLRLGKRFGCVVGVDLSAEQANVMLADAQLHPLATRQVALDVRLGPQTVMPMIGKLIEAMLQETNTNADQILALGFGVPAPVEFQSGTMIHPILMAGWDGFSLREYIRASLDWPVVVDNDVNVMALGELWQQRRNATSSTTGASVGAENFVVVKLGLGIGAAIVASGEIYRGTDGAAGDIAHICVDPNGPRCMCGNFGCLELLAGTQAIVKAALEAARLGKSAVFLRFLEGRQGLQLADVGQAAREGDLVANEIIGRTGSVIGQVLAATVNLLNPSRILIGGEVAHLSPLVLSSIRQSIYARSVPLSTRTLRVDYTRLGEQAGVFGTVVLALVSHIRGVMHEEDATLEA